jgi:endonuclease III-like uncharacterized protein
MVERDEVIEELVSMILMQHDEIKKLERKIEQVKRYIDVYEEYIKRGDY